MQSYFVRANRAAVYTPGRSRTEMTFLPSPRPKPSQTAETMNRRIFLRYNDCASILTEVRIILTRVPIPKILLFFQKTTTNQKQHMYRITQTLITISAAVCCLACGRHANQPNDTSSFAIDTITVLEDNDTPVDSIIKSIEYVKLQSFENALIGKVSKIIVTEDHIVVADTWMAKAVFIFDRKGNAQAVISRLGRGPQEYTSLDDVAVTPDQKQIAVLDNGSTKLIYYDMDGKFIKRQEIPLRTMNMEFIDDRTMLYTTYGTSKRDDIPAENVPALCRYKYECSEEHLPYPTKFGAGICNSSGDKEERGQIACTAGIFRHDLQGYLR